MSFLLQYSVVLIPSETVDGFLHSLRYKSPEIFACMLQFKGRKNKVIGGWLWRRRRGGGVGFYSVMQFGVADGISKLKAVLKSNRLLVLPPV